MMHLPKLSRRSTLLGLTSAVVLSRASLALAAAPTDQRLAVVILRGAMDGLSAVVPYGDPDLAKWRPELLPPGPGQAGGLLDLGGFYGLHPSLIGMHGLYQAGELLPVHAVAGHYRSRSHFEAQDYLESGSDRRMDSGWLNRVLSLMPSPVMPGQDPAVAVSVTVPLLLRGPVGVATWAPPTFDPLDADLYFRVVKLNQPDPVTGPALMDAMRQRGFSEKVLASGTPPPGQDAFALLCGSAARLMQEPDGPRVAALELEGWDTHTGQPPRIAAALSELDAGLVALKAGLGDVWKQTVVLVVTEFGRTVRADGTLGTDHGTGTAAFLAGGAVAGGRVQANWPGLAQRNLFENRDLQPTADLREIGKGLLMAHLGLDAAALATVFPDSEGVSPMGGLLRS
jgi:uncharacterized protein (DUF1501 family)